MSSQADGCLHPSIIHATNLDTSPARFSEVLHTCQSQWRSSRTVIKEKAQDRIQYRQLCLHTENMNTHLMNDFGHASRSQHWHIHSSIAVRVR